MASFFASFGQYFSQSLKALFSRFGLFFQLALVFTVLSFGIEWLVSYSGLTSLEQNFSWQAFPFYLGLIVVGLGLSLLSSLCFTYASNETLHQRASDFSKVFSFSFKNFRRGLGTFFRIFWFIMKFVLVLSLIFVVVMFIVGIVAALILKNDFAETSSPLVPLFSILPFVIILPFALYRVIQVQFAYYFLIDKNLTPKESLQASIAAVRKNIWKLLGYMVLYGIIAFAVIFLIAFLFSFLFGETVPLLPDEKFLALAYSTPMGVILNFVLELLGGFTGVLYILFANAIYLKFKD